MPRQDQNRTADALPDVPGYRLLRVIGSGGMSAIYLGEQLSLHREVAIKVMLPEALADEVSRLRFENEARTIARLEHPHIVGIHDVGRTVEGLPYYSMPYLARGHLGQRLADGDPERARAIVRALLSALAYAHARGVIHRDVKAENVLFDEAERPLLADFGIALRRDQGARVTTAGFAVGSTAYMAPEQARGEDVDARVDLYSLGVLTWEMLTGQLPFNAGDALSMAVMHAQDPVPRLPPPLRHWQAFLDRALAKSPAKRFADAGEMLAALDKVPAVSAVRTRVRTGDRMRRVAAGLRRTPGSAWIALGLLVAAGIGLSARDDDRPQFFRAADGQPGARGLPVPAALPNQSVTASVDDAMLRAAPASPAERWVTAAERQLGAARWTAPAGDNAVESLLAAWQADPAHQRLPALIDQLLASLGRDAAKRLESGDVARAKTALEHARRLADATARTDGDAMQAARGALAGATTARIGRAERRFDRAAALAAVDDGKRVGMDDASLKPLRARAQAIPQAGDRVRIGKADMVLARSGASMLAASARPVTRDEYARFAAATGRGESLCRERASLLRIVARRSWRAPGFDQAPSEAVVCVSWQDARAFADWSRRTGGGVRLPTAAEAAALPRAAGSRAVAVWTSDCSGGCGQRIATGPSWRGGGGSRPLDAERGYDDVGLRLVRDP